MHTRSHPRRRFAQPALALLFCLGASQAPAAPKTVTPPPAAPTADTTVEKAEKPSHKVAKGKVAPLRIASKPQRPVKQLKPK